MIYTLPYTMIISYAFNFKSIGRRHREMSINLLVYCSTFVVLFTLFNIIPNYI